MASEVPSYEDYVEGGSLGRHETFTPRYGWLKKGYDAAKEDADVFRAVDAIQRLGVGKNMVRSIRYWCQAFKVLDTDPSGGMVPTNLGNSLLADDGWDPYLEDVASLWLLHWQLFVPPLDAVSWALAFNRCNLWSFDTRQLSRVIKDSARKYNSLSSLSDNSFARDASCIIRMYARVRPTRESEIQCPFTEMGIMRPTEDPNSVRFDTSTKHDLPPLIFAASCFSFIAHYVPPGPKTVSIHRLTHDANSPGVVFKLTESAVGAYLHEAEEKMEGFALIDILGGMQLHLNEHPLALHESALEKYYMEQ